jgi:hypothetical protein
MAQRRKNIRRIPSANGYQVPELKYEQLEEELTATGGLGPILDLFLDNPFFGELCESLPRRVSNASYDTEAFALILLCGFFVGYDSLDDLEYFQSHPLIVQRFGVVPTAKAFGDWLRDFDAEDIQKLKTFVRHHARFCRKQIDPRAPLLIDMDSTSHVQHGLKMEC